MNYHIYAVTLYRFEDLDDFYNDMETPGGSVTIPDRNVDVDLKKLTSKVTHYKLTPSEAKQVETDERVQSVEWIDPDSYPKLFSYARTSSQNADDLNWGLDVHSDSSFSTLPFTGKHVDVVIADDDGWQPDHPEFLDDNGNSRVVEYNWYQHASEVGDIFNIGRTWDYTRDTNNGYHNIHVAGTAAGRSNGWAKDANIYFIGLAFSGNSSTYNVSSSLVFDYIRAFHNNKPINPVTGRKNPTIVNNSWGSSQGWGLFGINPLSVDKITYQGQDKTPSAGATTQTYLGRFGAYSKDSLVSSWPSNLDPKNKTVKFKTSSSSSAPTVVDRMVTWPASWEKIPNQVLSFTSDNPSNSNNEIYVQGAVDVRNDTLIEATCENSQSYIRLKKIINNTLSLDVNFYGPDISIDMRGLTRMGYFPYPVPFRFIVESHPAPGDTIEYDVGWNISTHEYNTQTLSNTDIDTLSEDWVEIPKEELISPSPTSYSGTATEITHDPLPGTDYQDFENDGWTYHPHYDDQAGQHITDYDKFVLPWDISYLGETYDTIWAHYGSYLTFGEKSAHTKIVNDYTPLLPKLFVGAQDVQLTGGFASLSSSRYREYLYSKSEGTAPNRKFSIANLMWESYLSRQFGRVWGSSPDLLWKATFYENEVDRIDISIGENSVVENVGGWTLDEIKQYGFTGRQYGYYSSSLVTDIMSAIDDGIILVCAAGNDNNAQYDPTHINYNNHLTLTTGSEVYYNRGGTPGAAGGIDDNAIITVGALDHIKFSGKETRTDFSNIGNLVDVFSAGEGIQSAWPDSGKTGTGYPVTKNGYKYAKIRGTSMASPQVCGILACLLEKYPDMNQKQAREILNTFSIKNQMYDLPPGTWDHVRSLEEANNRVLFLKNTRKNNKPTYPPVFKGRQRTGALYPRNQIRRRKKV